MISSGFLLQLFAGALVTLKLAASAFILGSLIGLIAAIFISAHNYYLRTITQHIIDIIRGLPEMLILFFIYFGLTSVISNLLGHYVEISSFAASVSALTLIFSAYASQVFRGAFDMVSKGQIEAAYALSLSKPYIFLHIQLPLALRHAIPGIENLWLVLLKDTAIVMLIGMPDLMGQAKLAASTTHQAFTYFFLAACIYLAISLVSRSLIYLLKKQANKHVVESHPILA